MQLAVNSSIKKTLVRLFLAFIVVVVTSSASARNYSHYTNKFPRQFPLLSQSADYKALAAEPKKLYEFVSNSIRLQLYPGVMRGVRGCFLTRAGNSLDQSLLLAHLLMRRRISVRIAYGQLSAQQAQKMLQLQFKSELDQFKQRQQTKADLTALKSQAKDDAQKQQVDQVIQVANNLNIELNNVYQFNKRIVHPYVSKVLTQQRLNEIKAADQTKLTQYAQQHYWVQAKINNQWVDLDPTLRLAWGDKATTVTQTFNVNRIPRKLLHTVSITLSAVFQQGDTRKTKTLLTVKTDSASLSHLPVILLHPGLKRAGNPVSLGLGGAFGALNRELGGNKDKKSGLSYYPLLLIGSRGIAGKTLKMKGWIKNCGGGLAGNIGGQKSCPEVEIVAEDLQISIQSPGQSNKTNNKTYAKAVFDRAGLAQRTSTIQAAWKLQATDQLKVEHKKSDQGYMPQALQNVYVYQFLTGDLAKPQEKLQYIKRNSGITRHFRQTDILNLLHSMLNSYLEFNNLVRDYKLKQQGISYIAKPNLVALSIAPSVSQYANSKGKRRKKASLGLNLIDTSRQLVNSSDYFSVGAVALASEQVFVDYLVNSYVRYKELNRFIVSAANILRENEMAASNTLVWIDSDSSSELSSIPKDLAPAIKRGSSKYYYLIPRQRIQYGDRKRIAWFRIDKSNGYLTDNNPFNEHAATSEYIQNLKDRLKTVQTICMFKQCLEAAIAGATGMLQILRGNVSMSSVSQVYGSVDAAQNCSRVKLKVSVYKEWKTCKTQACKDIRKKMRSITSRSKQKNKLSPPTRDEYKKLRKRSPGEFSDKSKRDRKDDEDWDHTVELACGGEHSPKNINPLNKSYNRSLGAILGTACRKLCEGMSIDSIEFVYDLPGLPGKKKKVGWYKPTSTTHYYNWGVNKPQACGS